MPDSTQHSTSPIKDTNKNGKLEGKEIVQQIKNQKVHTILGSAAGAELLAVSYNSMNQWSRDHANDAFAHVLNARIVAIVDEYSKITPQAKQELEATAQANAQRLALKHGASPQQATEKAAQAVGAVQDKLDFAKHFAKTFKNGVHIEGNDIPAIMSHFSGQPTKSGPKAPGRS